MSNNPVPNVTMRDIWKYNHSMLFVLPIFTEGKMKTATIPQINYPIVQVCLDSGLINTYLSYPEHDDKHKDRNFIHLLFDATVVQQDTKITNSKYFSFSDAIIDSDHFESVKLFPETNRVLYTLEVPSSYKADLALLIDGKYSKVSKEYKNTVRLTQEDIPKTSNNDGVYIAMNNIPYSIVTKAQFLRVELEIATYMNIPVEAPEYYSKFNMEKEIFNPSLLN